MGKAEAGTTETDNTMRDLNIANQVVPPLPGRAVCLDPSMILEHIDMHTHTRVIQLVRHPI